MGRPFSTPFSRIRMLSCATPRDRVCLAGANWVRETEVFLDGLYQYLGANCNCTAQRLAALLLHDVHQCQESGKLFQTFM